MQRAHQQGCSGKFALRSCTYGMDPRSPLVTENSINQPEDCKWDRLPVPMFTDVCLDLGPVPFRHRRTVTVAKRAVGDYTQ